MGFFWQHEKYRISPVLSFEYCILWNESMCVMLFCFYCISYFSSNSTWLIDQLLKKSGNITIYNPTEGNIAESVIYWTNGRNNGSIQNTEFWKNNFVQIMLRKSGDRRKSSCGVSHYLSHYHASNQEEERVKGNGSNDGQSLKLEETADKPG